VSEIVSGVVRTRVKVCCIGGADEVRLAVAAGVDALGFVSAMPSGPGVIDEALIAELVATVPPPVSCFLLTCAHDPHAIADQVRRAGVDVVQLVDALPHGAHAALRRLLPHRVRLVQVIHVVGDASADEALSAAAHVDALLLDSGNPALAVKELGGTGRVHDWRVSAEIVRRSPVPVFLAGGLRAENVADAVRAVRPFGVDVCSGVRTGGRLDEAKLRAFVDRASARA
jgi:phosphoribosylanthranilate isomerase